MFETLPETALGEASLSDPLTIAAPAVVLIATYILFYEGMLFQLSSMDWRGLRAQLPLIDDVARAIGAYTTYEIDPDREGVGRLDVVDPGMAVELFKAELGYLDGPVAAHKGLPDGREEFASLVKYGIASRDVWIDGQTLEALSRPVRFVVLLLLPNQRHVTLFRAAGGGVFVTAHVEYSAHSLFFATWHLRAKGMDTDAGVQDVVLELRDVDVFEPTRRAVDLIVEAEAEL